MPAENKIVIFGTTGSGKTQLVNVISNEPFNEIHEPTQLVKYSVLKTGNTESNDSISHPLWKVSGNEKYEGVTPMYFNGARIVVLCIDLSQPFNGDEIRRLIHHSKRHMPASASFMIVGTKSDLCVQPQQYLDSLQIDSLFDGVKPLRIITSAKENIGIDQLLDRIHDCIPVAERWNARFETAEAQLRDKLKMLPKEKIEAIEQHLAQLTSILSSQKVAQEKAQAIEDFSSNCRMVLQGKHPNILKAALTLAAVAAVTLIAGVIGFGIGLLAGAWLGPASFLTAITTGSAAAIAVVSVSASLGFIGGGVGFFKASSPTVTAQVNAIDEFKQQIAL